MENQKDTTSLSYILEKESDVEEVIRMTKMFYEGVKEQKIDEVIVSFVALTKGK